VTPLCINLSFREKQELVGSIFKDFLIYEGGEYRTAQLSILASLIFNDIKGFQESGIKKGDISVALSSLAPLIDPKYNPQPLIDYVILYKTNR
jgi:hypothetical protein